MADGFAQNRETLVKTVYELCAYRSSAVIIVVCLHRPIAKHFHLTLLSVN